MTIFFRIQDSDDKASALKANIHNRVGKAIYEVNPDKFIEVPGSPFAYWVSNKVRGAFKLLPRLEAQGRTAKSGLQTSDDFRFVRNWCEVAEDQIGKRWFCLTKGGAFSPYYADLYLVVNWDLCGYEMKSWAGSLYNESHWSRIIKNTEFYFRPGLTWTQRTTSNLGFRIMPEGCVFGNKGPAAFVDGDDYRSLLMLLAITNSMPFRYFVDLQIAAADAAARSYEVGIIQRTPLPSMDESAIDKLSILAGSAWSIKHSLDAVNETSHAFILPKILLRRTISFEPIALEIELATIQNEINEITFDLYNLESDDRITIEQWTKKETTDSKNETEDDFSEEENHVTSERDAMLSWCIGVAFGRFDIRLATGERIAPSKSKAFEPQQMRSPSMLPDGDEQSHYYGAILVDDPRHADDLCSIVQDILERVKAPCIDELSLQFCRNWIGKEFFPLHIKMYSKSRRKAPIYWQLATASASYSVWLYIHTFTQDTLYMVQNDYVAPKLLMEERNLESMRQQFGPLPKSNERKQLATQESFVEELRTFLAEVKLVAPLWNPELDDGVVINFAPLWRLVPHNKAWQKELKVTWDALCRGDYDWAHWAMHLWPERVVPKCASDRSLAIANLLEDVFWVEGNDGKWNPRTQPTQSVDDLIHTRTSLAMKAALQSLLEAPVASTKRKRRTHARGGTE